MNKHSEVILEARSVSKIFSQSNTQALSDINLSIFGGEFVAITGPSGSGKSTLLNILAGLIKPTSGKVFFRGDPLSEIKKQSFFRRDNIGFIFQDFYLYPGLTAIENVILPIANRLFVASSKIRRAEELLRYLGLGDKSMQNVNTLSTGERQRVCIARALLNEPGIILADEPTGCLDSKNTEQVLTILQDIHKNKSSTIIMVTHDAHVASCSGRQVKIIDGKMQ